MIGMLSWNPGMLKYIRVEAIQRNSRRYQMNPGMLDHRLEGEIPLYLLYTNDDID